LTLYQVSFDTIYIYLYVYIYGQTPDDADAIVDVIDDDVTFEVFDVPAPAILGHKVLPSTSSVPRQPLPTVTNRQQPSPNLHHVTAPEQGGQGQGIGGAQRAIENVSNTSPDKEPPGALKKGAGSTALQPPQPSQVPLLRRPWFIAVMTAVGLLVIFGIVFGATKCFGLC
jgi:hypothetical protein